ncbi:MAG: hypothetical protein OXE81_03735 [Gammaproteobacteria bacterium]|nr:hypothetical protein [Gammaproteobacteria bacterium]
MRGPCYLALDAGQLVAKGLVDKSPNKSPDKSNVASLMMRMEAARDDQALLELLADSAEWLAQGRAQGLEQGIEQGREQGLERGLAEGERRGQRVLLQSLAARRFGDHTAERLNVFLDEAPHSERAMQAGNWLMDCQTEAEFLQRLEAAA